MYLCLDIGQKYTGVCKITDSGDLFYAKKILNPEVLKIEVESTDCILIEFTDSVHGKIGNTTVDTIFWIGRIYQHFKTRCVFVNLIGRKEVLKALACKKDSDVVKLLKGNVKSINNTKLVADCWQAYALYKTFKL